MACVPTEHVELSCGYGVDNDCDGLVDCAQPQCDGRSCAPGKRCGNGSCSRRCIPSEAVETDCADQLDSDCDGKVDCADEDCEGQGCGNDCCWNGAEAECTCRADRCVPSNTCELP
jgi:hypothetical protein